MTPKILRRLDDLRALRRDWIRNGESLALVPTMGALHAGHLSLVEAARAACDHVVVTIFVNPKQFNNPQDLASYPRTEVEDAAKLAPFGVDAIYVPDPDQMYPDGYATTVSVTGVTEVMDGPNRPGHFDGVATVVAKLFLQSGADKAFFGEKDYQQLLVVKRMVRDLNIPIEVIGCPTVREASGLALSSRNLRLSAQARDTAGALNRMMETAAEQLRAGAAWGPLQAGMRDALVQAGFSEVEYIDLRSATDLSEQTGPETATRIFVAAWLDGVRLIDNIAV